MLRTSSIIVAVLVGGLVILAKAQPPTSRADHATASIPPIARFQELSALPPETARSLYSLRAAGDWLYRMHQANGRFFPGYHPQEKQAVSEDRVDRQLLATIALAQVGRFTGEVRWTIRAKQSILALRSETTSRSETMPLHVVGPMDEIPPVVVAAMLAQAIYEVADPEKPLIADAEDLIRFVISQQHQNGSFPGTDAEGCAQIVQALIKADLNKPDSPLRQSIGRGLNWLISQFREKPSSALAATILPILSDVYPQGKDSRIATISYQLADWICDCQYTRRDAPKLIWVGGFRSHPQLSATPEEPGAEASLMTRGLAAATRLTRQVPHLTRYPKYRQATVDGLQFLGELQFTPNSALQIEPHIRHHYLLGAIAQSGSNWTVRPDTTALSIMAHLQYLQSGAALGSP